ncbi:PilZ domain-containing protein [Bradyrhizobium sp. WYCCWR 13023]|uniref:PilZ domain-containing protein n=2 Tax=Nitrobacteraceae TaxID=41294 RepID=A0A9X1RIT0_9BRAD|nr:MULTISPECIES: PilZ domain-containing protein [Bradyrhizobium]MCG2632450.1 PilZ domain-containing protein [Bradyrhizobium zhengyangense]MCG2673219.1 PilZ domain-containing protein [Bradyrhizobium zhengyangense]MDA9520139.1 pilus assembly protein PilZ [Bradyrhizobium sp. CCBAU 11434]
MEKRHVRRRRVFKAAMIEFPGGAFSCVVRDLSDCGANLDVPSQIGIPHEFMLSIPTAQLHRLCRAVWRSDKRIGIAFDSAESSCFQLSA